MKRYHYTECGLDNVYLLNGYTIEGEGGDAVVSVHDIHDLHREIGMLLIEKPAKLSGKEIRFIRHSMDFSQKRLGVVLGVDYQSVLAWEKGKTKITKQTDIFLRTLFFAYLNRDSGLGVYDKINEIADMDARRMAKENKEIVFREISDEWRLVA